MGIVDRFLKVCGYVSLADRQCGLLGVDGVVSLKSEGSADASSGFDSVKVSGEFRLFCNRLRSGLTREDGNVAAVHRSGWGCMSALSDAEVERS